MESAEQQTREARVARFIKYVLWIAPAMTTFFPLPGWLPSVPVSAVLTVLGMADPAHAAADGGVETADVGSEATPPSLRTQAPAPYPAEALAQHLDGNVGLELDISADGRVVGVRVVAPASMKRQSRLLGSSFSSPPNAEACRWRPPSTSRTNSARRYRWRQRQQRQQQLCLWSCPPFAK
jgi:hypothetical protein